jgi:hypothetical protein
MLLEAVGPSIGSNVIFAPSGQSLVKQTGYRTENSSSFGRKGERKDRENERQEEGCKARENEWLTYLLTYLLTYSLHGTGYYLKS